MLTADIILAIFLTSPSTCLCSLLCLNVNDRKQKSKLNALSAAGISAWIAGMAMYLFVISRHSPDPHDFGFGILIAVTLAFVFGNLAAFFVGGFVYIFMADD